MTRLQEPDYMLQDAYYMLLYHLSHLCVLLSCGHLYAGVGSVSSVCAGCIAGRASVGWLSSPQGKRVNRKTYGAPGDEIKSAAAAAG
jgi:hypothetical protein